MKVVRTEDLGTHPYKHTHTHHTKNKQGNKDPQEAFYIFFFFHQKLGFVFFFLGGEEVEGSLKFILYIHECFAFKYVCVPCDHLVSMEVRKKCRIP